MRSYICDRTHAELKKQCKELGLTSYGKKEDLWLRVENKRDEIRKHELLIQSSEHIISITQHACKVAKTEKLSYFGKPRVSASTCKSCGTLPCQYTCEKCDWDICEGCILRTNEIPLQLQKHIHTSLYHPCKVAKTEELVFRGKPRQDSAECSYCRQLPCVDTCEKCDWDICLSCINKAAEASKVKLLAQEKSKARSEEVSRQKALHNQEHCFHDCPLANTIELTMNKVPRKDLVQCTWYLCKKANPVVLSCESCDFDICLDCIAIATTINKKRKRGDDIIEVPELVSNIRPENQKENNLLKYVVWSSCGYPNDGWHSYNPPPKKIFDSSFDNVQEANERVRYLFIKENPYEYSRRDMEEKCGDIGEKIDKENGCLSMSICPDDSELWTVAVVPKEVFERYTTEEESYYEGELSSFY